jgi:hypothetical protein
VLALKDLRGFLTPCSTFLAEKYLQLSYIVQGNTPVHQSIGNIQVTYRDSSNNLQPTINPPLTDLALGRWTLEKMRIRSANLSGLACQAFALGGGLT